jgi:hypothetical protein
MVVVLSLIALALTRHRTAQSSGRTPAPWLVAAVSVVLLSVRSFVPTGWWGTLAATGAIVAWLVVMARWSRRSGWGGVHVLAAVVGVLLSIGGPAFATTPLGDVPLATKLASNVVLLALVLMVAAVGYRAERRLEGSPAASVAATG